MVPMKVGIALVTGRDTFLHTLRTQVEQGREIPKEQIVEMINLVIQTINEWQAFGPTWRISTSADSSSAPASDAVCVTFVSANAVTGKAAWRGDFIFPDFGLRRGEGPHEFCGVGGDRRRTGRLGLLGWEAKGQSLRLLHRAHPRLPAKAAVSLDID